MSSNVQVYQSKSNFKKYYEIGEIGKGSQGNVIKVLDDYSNVYALKKQLEVRKYEKAFLDEIIKINEENRLKLIQKLKQELQAQNGMLQLDSIQLQQNNNQNKLLQIYEHFKMEDCSEFCNGGNLEAELKEKQNYNLYETANIIIDICEQLEIIHSMNYIVLDLKPANIVVQKSNQRYKICDFGSILFCNENQENPTYTQSRCITPCYQAPHNFISFMAIKNI